MTDHVVVISITAEAEVIKAADIEADAEEKE